MYGSLNISNLNDGLWKRINFQEIDIHNDFNTFGAKSMGKFDADIAILTTLEAIEFSTATKKICLPPKNVNVFNIEGTVVGYGLTENQIVHENIPKYVEIPSVDQVECLFSDEVYVTLASKRTFCAGSAEKKAIPCRGNRTL